jgi:hypothetical protein
VKEKPWFLFTILIYKAYLHVCRIVHTNSSSDMAKILKCGTAFLNLVRLEPVPVLKYLYFLVKLRFFVSYILVKTRTKYYDSTVLKR